MSRADREEGEAPLEGPRRRGRELAFSFLYACDIQRGGFEGFEGFVDEEGDKGPAVGFARDLVRGTLEQRRELDKRLGELARSWKVERMAVVDRNILRLAAYELLHSETPTGIILNEAVELAKRYGTERSKGFVNGILDQLAKKRVR